MQNVIIYHANCQDGWCSAYVASKNLESPLMISASYGDPPPNDLEGKDIYILDFSYPKEVLLEIKKNANSLIVLDHHKTAKENLDGLDFCTFDMDKSGAQLTLEHFHGKPKHLSELVAYCQDRDLWQWKLPYSKEVNAALASYPMTIEAWDHFPDMLAMQVAGLGILRYQQQLIDNAVKQAGMVELAGYAVPIINTTVLISEIVGTLAEGHPFAVGWFEDKNNDRIFSLRSRKGGIDVSDVARLFGGGGHKNAAGFKQKKA